MIQDYKSIFRQAIEKRASDIHIVVGVPHILRISGSLVRVGTDILKEDVDGYVKDILNEKQQEELKKMGEIDLSLEVKEAGRFRINIYKQKDTYAIAARTIENNILQLKDLGLPDVIAELSKLQKGLILVTGPTGSGKSTTLASLIDLINRTRDVHILTLEDPIEFVHTHKKGIVSQREIGRDSKDYNQALRAALREDPDVILIGEMRDAESIQIAITAAETGHLVLSTLHTIGASKTVDRVIDIFPSDQQQQIRIQLAAVLQAVVSQQLIKRIDGEGRVIATEVMLINPAISNLIREAKTHQIDTQIQIGKKLGMQSMDNSLYDLYSKNQISQESAMAYSPDSDNFEKTFFKGKYGSGGYKF